MRQTAARICVRYVQYDFPAVSLTAQAFASPGDWSHHSFGKSALVTWTTGQRSSSEILETLFFLARQNPPRALSKVHPFRRLLSKTGSSLSVALRLDIVLEGTEQCTGAARNDLTGMSEKQLDKKGEKEGWTSKAAP